MLGSVLKKAASVALIAGSIAGFYVINRERIVDLATYYVPCRWPITYSVGTLDPRFGISESELVSALSDAERLWEDVAEKDLFALAEKGMVPVNLIYDERQEASLENERLSGQIETGRETYDDARRTYESIRLEYEHAFTEYDALRTAFEARSEQYERDVRAANRKGGAAKSEYDRLQAERGVLMALQAELESTRTFVNGLAARLNAQVSTVNSLAQNINEYVQEYNSGEFIGKEFEEGLFVRDADGSRILIYEFTSRDELVRVLAHEFGHALGISHNENPGSIMYPVNDAEHLSLSGDDIASLRARCGIEN